MIIWVLCIVNTLILFYLTFFHFRQNFQTNTFGQTMCKVKTSILLLMLLFEFIVVFRYTLYFRGDIYNSILIVQQFIESFILLQICYFFAKKAAHFIENSEQTLKVMRMFMYIALAVFATIALFQIITTVTLHGWESNALCKTWYFITAACFN